MNGHKTIHKYNLHTKTYQLRHPFRWTRWLPTPGNVLFNLFTIAFLILTQNVWARSGQEAATVSASNTSMNATTFSYQGRLMDEQGNPLSGNVDLAFTLYDAPVGGNVVWETESHANVPVSDGLFKVALGSQTPGGISSGIWNSNLYLEITVNGEILSPREPIRSVPMASMASLTEQVTLASTDQIVREALTIANHPEEPATQVGNTSIILAKPGKIYVQCNATVKPHEPPTAWIGLRVIATKGALVVKQADQMYQGTDATNYVSWDASGILELPESGMWTIQCGLHADSNSPILHTYSITAFQIE